MLPRASLEFTAKADRATNCYGLRSERKLTQEVSAGVPIICESLAEPISRGSHINDLVVHWQQLRVTIAPTARPAALTPSSFCARATQPNGAAQ